MLPQPQRRRHDSFLGAPFRRLTPYAVSRACPTIPEPNVPRRQKVAPGKPGLLRITPHIWATLRDYSVIDARGLG